MAERLLGTGVELRVPSRWAGELEDPPAIDPATGEVNIEVQVFAGLDDDGRLGDLRIGGCHVTRFEFHAAPWSHRAG